MWKHLYLKLSWVLMNSEKKVINCWSLVSRTESLHSLIHWQLQASHKNIYKIRQWLEEEVNGKVLFREIYEHRERETERDIEERRGSKWKSERRGSFLQWAVMLLCYLGNHIHIPLGISELNKKEPFFYLLCFCFFIKGFWDV